MGELFLVVTEKGSNNLILGDLVPLRRGAESLRQLPAVLWAYRTGIQLQYRPVGVWLVINILTCLHV